MSVQNQINPQVETYAGVKHGFNHEVGSYAAEELIPFGYPVELGTDADKQVKKATTGASVIGIAARSQVVEASESYEVMGMVPVVTFGRLSVNTSGTVTTGTEANIVLADGTFTSDAVAPGTIEASGVRKITFVTTDLKNNKAIVEVR